MSTTTVGFFKPSTRARYGLRLVLALARTRKKTLALNTLAKQLGVSKKYLEKISRILKEQGIIEATRGKKGGYRLIPDPDQINLLKLLTALEGELALSRCFTPDCPKLGNCRAGNFWQSLGRNISQFLDKTTIADIIKEV